MGPGVLLRWPGFSTIIVRLVPKFVSNRYREELLNTIVEANLPPEEIDDDALSEVVPVPIEQALQALQTLKEWVLQQPQDEPEFMRNVSKVASRLQKAKVERLQQVTLDRYFLAGPP